MRISFVLILIGLSLVGYSMTLQPYTDRSRFYEESLELATTTQDSQAYWRLREEMLTGKFRLQDYGATFLSLGVLLFFLSLVKFRAPSRKWMIVAIGIGLPFLTVTGFVLDLLQGMVRDEFPSWADSLAIPLMNVPVHFVILLVWAVAHLGFLRRSYLGNAPLRYALSRHSNLWLLFVSSVTFLLTGLLVLDGSYFYAVPGCVWLYFYLSLAAGTRVRNATQQIAQPDASSAGAG